MLNMGALPTANQWNTYQEAAKARGLEAILFDIRDIDGLRRAFAEATRRRADAMIDALDALSSANQALVIDLAQVTKLPVIYVSREFVDAGGLVSYGVHYPDLYYRAAAYVDKILKGANPGDLAIERPTRLEMVINRKTANALGLMVPSDVLLRADHVIQ
jgi:putative ABC transport system substrate-binding protein